MVVCLISIPLLLIWLPLGMFVTRRYLSRMSCELTEQNLKVNKGMWVRVEKTIPLEKITDLGMVQGPIMRHYGLHTLSVETAGQSPGGALVSLTGIVDAKEFREAVLRQRDLLRKDSAPSTVPAAPDTGGDTTVLAEIRDSLLRIEKLLDK